MTTAKKTEAANKFAFNRGWDESNGNRMSKEAADDAHDYKTMLLGRIHSARRPPHDSTLKDNMAIFAAKIAFVEGFMLGRILSDDEAASEEMYKFIGRLMEDMRQETTKYQLDILKMNFRKEERSQ